MSNILTPFPLVFASFVLILQFFTNVKPQDVDIRIKINANTTVSADIRSVFAPNSQAKDLWFLNEYAGVGGLLTERFSTIYLYDRRGYLIARKRFTPSDTVNSRNIGGFGYSVSLKLRSSRSEAAHVSWATAEGGILMLDDLLPQSLAKTAKVKLELPDGWKAASTDYLSSMEQSDPSETDLNNFVVSDIKKGVIFIGPKDRRRVVWSGRSRIVLNLRGEWQFNVDDGLSAAAAVFANYEKAIGTISPGSFLIGMSNFQTPIGAGEWEADTRGRTVTIVSSDMPFKSQSLQRLHEQLRHELFHLWIPNGVNLSGNYDWFYEGFALYQSLKTGVGLNRLRFDDFLDTLSRAYEIDKAQANRLSLIDASKNRWSGANTQVYARGMLVAFVCDLALLDKSKGKVSVTNVLREVFEKHSRLNEPADGNAAVIAVLRNHRELIPIVDRYVSGTEPLDWTALLKTAGIEAEVNDRATKLIVTPKPTGRQKDLLDTLGYNNWRKLSLNH